jgi:hypothetical protein
MRLKNDERHPYREGFDDGTGSKIQIEHKLI